MDDDVRRAMRVIARAGSDCLDELLEAFPVLRHDMRVVELFSLKRYEVEHDDDWDKWRAKIPAIPIPAGWKIQMQPPFTGATARFVVNGEVSVYLDCHNRLAVYGYPDPTPYWEIHPASRGGVERFDMDDVQGLVDGIQRSLAAPDEPVQLDPEP